MVRAAPYGRHSSLAFGPWLTAVTYPCCHVRTQLHELPWPIDDGLVRYPLRHWPGRPDERPQAGRGGKYLRGVGAARHWPREQQQRTRRMARKIRQTARYNIAAVGPIVEWSPEALGKQPLLKRAPAASTLLSVHTCMHARAHAHTNACRHAGMQARRQTCVCVFAVAGTKAKRSVKPRTWHNCVSWWWWWW